MRYSSSRRGGWGPALEDSTGGAEVIGEGAAPVAAFEINVTDTDEDGAPLEAVDASGEPTVDVTLPETTEALDEVEEAEEVVEKLDETSEVLENYAVAIEQRIRENGGLTPSEWELVQIGLRSRIKNIQALTPSKESFGYSRLSASNEALDAIKEGIKNVWEAIKKAIMGVINRVRKWWAGAMSDAARLGKRAKGIREKAKEKSTSLKEDVDDHIKLNAKNMVGGNGKPFDDLKKYVAAANLYAAIANKYLVVRSKHDRNTLDDLTNIVKDAIDGLTKEGSSVSDSLSVVYSKLQQIQKGSDPDSTMPAAVKNDVVNLDDITYKNNSIIDIPGNKMFVFTSDVRFSSSDISPSSATKFFEKWGYFGFENQVKEHKELDNDIEFKILDIDQIVDICRAIEETCKYIVDYKRNFEVRERNVDKYVKSMDAQIREISRDDSYKDKAQSRNTASALIRGTAEYAKNTLSRDAKLITDLLSKSKDLLAYAARSSAMYQS